MTERLPRISLSLPMGADSFPRAREALYELRDELEQVVLEHLQVLLQTFLETGAPSTNHGEPQEVSLEVWSSASIVRVELSDSSGPHHGEPVSPLTARRVHVVDHLADRWGMIAGDRQRIWLEIDRARRGR